MSNAGNGGGDRATAGGTNVTGDADMSGVSQPVTEAEIEDIINSPDMLIEEKQARLEELSRRVGYREPVDEGEDFNPLGLQISEALNLLADGGHTYSAVDETDLDPEGPTGAPEDENGSSR
ncbi:hypothetical protein [Aurantimonas endophytica]|uniref:Uncharacterized protein n=1 Tax=Aurantimonas endophytica TaxID=1522175 RepID=A0A7W6MP16_9HYPH|nr:hypothetical protein [Aurantimonas endophytica]MBB4002465.1 hypothetical protein [Aurantimonas endophytica]MCO6401914.1 hypothetical protein [Aurantimonas endophytica]